jgi:hypothetical protein
MSIWLLGKSLPSREQYDHGRGDRRPMRCVWIFVFLFTLTAINYADGVALSVAAKPIATEFGLLARRDGLSAVVLLTMMRRPIETAAPHRAAIAPA